MSLISERVGYLLRRYNAEQVSEITGISINRISPTLGDLEPVEPNLRKNIYNFYGRQVYSDLRAAGASAVEARRYRSASVQKVLNRLGMRTELLEDLVSSRFEVYKQSLIKRGKYISDEDTLASLRDSIARNMGKSRKAPSKYNYESYPTLSYGTLDDNF